MSEELSLALFWRGKPIKDLSSEEVEEAYAWLSRQYGGSVEVQAAIAICVRIAELSKTIPESIADPRPHTKDCGIIS